MAKFELVILFCLFIEISFCEDCAIDNRTPDSSWEYQLHHDLKNCAHYDKPPLNGTEPLKISVYFILKFFSFTQDEEVFTTQNWVNLVWTDYRLKWDPTKYSGIEKVLMNSQMIWTPPLVHLNAVSGDEYPYALCDCEVSYKGEVRCVPVLIHETTCSTKLKNWPYDIQKCTLQFGPSSTDVHTHAEYTFNSKHGIFMLGAEYGSSWTIVGLESSVNPNRTEQLTLTFELERQAFGLGVIIVVPSLIVFVLTMTSVLWDVSDNIRLGLLCVSMLIHNCIITQISLDIPKHSADTPVILYFVRSSLVLTLFSLFLTFFLRYLTQRVVPPPEKIVFINDYVFNSKLRYAVWPKWDASSVFLAFSEDLVANKKVVEQWSDFACMVNSVFTFLMVIVYSFLFLFFMPVQMQPTLQ